MIGLAAQASMAPMRRTCPTSLPGRMRLALALVLIAALTVGVPAANAQIPVPMGPNYTQFNTGSGACGFALSGADDSTGGTLQEGCGTVINNGPSVGQAATVVGPTITGSGIVGSALVVSAGNAGAGG